MNDCSHRVAAACIEALKRHGLLHNRMFVTRLIRQLARQELVPEDLDHANGVDAISAIAETVIATRTTSSDTVLAGIVDYVWRDVYRIVLEA